MGLFGLIGPLAGWELRRLARRGRAFRVWLLFLYTLLLIFLVFAGLWFYPRPISDVVSTLFRISSSDAAAFTDRAAVVLLEAQLILVVAFTPALAASAVAEEKDRQTLPLLLTTQLTDREIIFGKAAGRVAFMLLTITSGVPVLLLAHFLGEVDFGFLALGYLIIFGTVLLCAATGMNAACRTSDYRSALLRAYAYTAVLCCAIVPPVVFVTPFGVLALVHNRSDGLRALAVGYPLAQAVVAAMLLAGAARSLRLREPGAGPPPASEFPLPPRPADPPLLRPKRVTSRPLPPLDDANPVLWKERCVGWRPGWSVPPLAKAMAVLFAVLSGLLFITGAWVLVQRLGKVLDPAEAGRLADQPGAPDVGGWLLTAAGVFAAGRYLLPLAVGITGAIAGERFRGTLDSLLSTPLDRRKLLQSKMQAHAERGSLFLGVAMAAVGMAFTADGGIRIGVAATVLVLSMTGLVMGVGAWLTVRCTTDVRAFRLLLPFVALAVGWPVGAWNLLLLEADVPRELLTRGLVAAACVSAVAGLVLWRLAGRRLERGD